MRIGSNAPTLAGPDPQDVDGATVLAGRAFTRTHDDPLMLPKQPAGVPPAGALTHYRIKQQIDDREGKLSGDVVIRVTVHFAEQCTRRLCRQCLENWIHCHAWPTVI